MSLDNQPILSILIPTIDERREMFNTLYRELDNQAEACWKSHPSLGSVHIATHHGPKFINGGTSVGEKRNGLVQGARGKYLCFLDDDETISPDYVETLLRLCYQDKDVCTFRSLFKCDTYWTVIDMSTQHSENEQATPERIVKRRAWHICPVKSEYAKQEQFKNINNAEDWEWFERVSQRIVTQAHTDRIIHQYNHSSKTSAVDELERLKTT